MIKRFIAYYKPHRVLFIIDMLCSVIIALCDLIYPIIAKNIINVYVPARALNAILYAALLLTFIYLLKYALNYYVCYWGHVVGVRMQADMRRDLFAHLEKLPFSFFDETKSGTLMSRLISDLFEVSELAHHGPEQLILSVMMLVGSFVMLSMINLPLTLIIFCVVPLIICFAVLLRRKMRDAFRRSREQIAEVNANIETALSGIRVSRAYTTEPQELQKFERENRLFVTFRSKALQVMGFFHASMNFFTDVLYLVVLVAGGLFYFYGKIDIGEFAAYLLYIRLFLDPIKLFVTLFEQLQEGMTGFRRFCEIMDVPPEEDSPDAETLGNVRGDIVFDDVSFSYGVQESMLQSDLQKKEEVPERHSVIRHLKLHIAAGTTVALVGPSGGGKTTICNLIPRFYEPNSGTITIDGQNITHFTRCSLRKNIGIVSQDVFLFTGTIRENIAYGKPDATDAEIQQAAKLANIHEYIQTLPNGYETEVGERGVKLSGGQKQRISIARVFLKNPPILILDEATSALDNATEMQIQQSLQSLSRGRTTIVVAHRLSTVREADNIVVLTENGIEQQGNHETLCHAGGLYEELYRYQLR